eukprot:10163744-Alexandrium_andersonii.AAC.1
MNPVAKNVSALTPEDCEGCGSEDCSFGVCDFAPSHPQTPRSALSSADSESARRTARNAPVGSFGCQF